MEVSEILKDPNFIALPVGEQQKVLQQTDANFSALPMGEQFKVLSSINVEPAAPPPETRGSIVLPKTGSLPPALLASVLKQESGNRDYNRDGSVVTSPRGARGRMQVLDSTNRDPGFGVKPAQDDSLEERARVGRDYLAALLGRYGDTKTALAAYNWGPGNVDKYGVEAAPTETAQYVARITGDRAAPLAQSGPTSSQSPASGLNIFNPGVREIIMRALAPREATASEPEPVQPKTEQEQPPSVNLVPSAKSLSPIEAIKQSIGKPPELLETDLSKLSNKDLLAEIQKSSPKGKFDYTNLIWSIKNPEQAKMMEGMSSTEKFLAGVGFGLTDMWNGVKQATSSLGENVVGSLPSGTTQKITQEGQQAREEFSPLRNYSYLARVGELTGKVAPTLILPGGVEGGPLMRAATAALSGGTLGATEFVPEGGSRLTNTALGAGAAGGMSGLMSATTKMGNIQSGNIPKTDVMKQGEKFGIRTTLSEDLTGQPGRGDILRERLPSWLGGIKDFRAAQNEDAKAAARTLFSNYIIDPSIDTTAAMKIANDAHLDRLYDKVRGNAVSVPVGPATEVRAAASELIDRYPTVFGSIQDNKIKRILTDISGDVSDKTVSTGLVGPAGNPITRKVTPEFSFNDLWELRKGLGREIGVAKNSRNDIAEGQLSKMYSAVSEDIDSMLSRSGGTALADFKMANDAFKQYSVKFDVMRQAYDKAAGTTGAGEMFSPKKFSTELKNLANNPEYKKNVRWSDTEVDEMTGLANILQVTKRAGQFLENPPTGQRYGALTAAGAIEGAAAGAAGIQGVVGTGGILAGTALIAKYLTTTVQGKALAMAASKAEPTSPRMATILDQIYRQVPKFAAENALIPSSPKPGTE